MDRERFDDLVRRLATTRTRRGVIRVGVGALLGTTALSVAGLDRDLADVKARKRKKKKAKPAAFSCPAATPVRCPNQLCCLAIKPTCCPATTQSPGGSCAPKDQTCCKSEAGGGSCPAEFPQCCLLRLGEGCCEIDQDCCHTSEDCTAPQVCDDFGCCVEETGFQTESSPRTRRVRESRRQR